MMRCVCVSDATWGDRGYLQMEPVSINVAVLHHARNGSSKLAFLIDCCWDNWSGVYIPYTYSILGNALPPLSRTSFIPPYAMDKIAPTIPPLSQWTKVCDVSCPRLLLTSASACVLPPAPLLPQCEMNLNISRRPFDWRLPEVLSPKHAPLPAWGGWGISGKDQANGWDI